MTRIGFRPCSSANRNRKYLKFFILGELKYENTAGNAPFYPRPMVAEIDSEKMLYMYASEYTLNSLLYHAYESDRLGIKVKLLRHNNKKIFR